MLAEMSSVVKVECFMFGNNFRTTTGSGYNESEVDLANHQNRLVQISCQRALGYVRNSIQQCKRRD